MKMQVFDNLAGSGPVIAQEIVTIGIHCFLDSRRQSRQHFPDFRERLRTGLVNTHTMKPWNQQCVPFSRRMNIQKRDQMFIFKELCARDLP